MNATTATVQKTKFVSLSEIETIHLGKNFSQQLQQNDVVALLGNLGSGKTRFVQGICSALNVPQHVSSPSFTLINEYESKKGKIYHFDFYRLNTIEEIWQLGFRDYLEGGGICLIEWAERAQVLLPHSRYDIFLNSETTKTNASFVSKK